MPMHLVMHAEVDSNCKYLEDLLHMKYDSNHIRGEWFEFSFMELVELYQALETFASVQLHQRWYEIVPNDYKEYIEHGAFNPKLPHFTRKEEEEFLAWIKDIPF